jgi:acyl carrier protein
MGLDSIEILMEVEDAFGIKIPDAEAETIITICDFHNCVWKHLEGRQVNKCHSQILFYRLRSDLAVQNLLPRSQITLSSSPDNLWSVIRRKQAYKQYELDSGLALPALELPGPWQDLFAYTALILVVGSLIVEFALINFFNFSSWLWLGTFAAIFLILGVSELLEPLRTKIAEPDMRRFTMLVLKLNYKKLAGKAGTSRTEMESVINQIIADKAGLDILEVTSEKRIGDDLGID